MTTDSGPDLMVLAAELTAELGETTAEGEGGVVSYRRAGRVFARVSADAVDVRLPADIAEAALHTPDTVALPGEPGWLRFEPRAHERHVSDRAEAWFRTAWRHAAGS